VYNVQVTDLNDGTNGYIIPHTELSNTMFATFMRTDSWVEFVIDGILRFKVTRISNDYGNNTYKNELF
jgi:hypothetical protein